MKYERRQSERDASKSAERYDREGDICNTTSPKMRRAGSASASDKIGEHAGAERKVLSEGWMVPWSKLRILASPLLHNGSHECACQTQHEAENPNSNHKHGKSWQVEGIGQLAAVVVELCDPGSYWDIWERRDWVIDLGSCCKIS